MAAGRRRAPMAEYFRTDVWPAILDVWPYIKDVVFFFIIIVPLLIAMAYFTYWERKFLGWMQLRRGPNVVGPLGLLQPFADGLKLFLKETIIPSGANPVIFLLAPVITFVLAMVAWVVIPFDDGWVVANINVGILYLFAISSLGVYGIIMAGWASNSKYAFLGALRSAAQMVSYEVSMGFVIVSVLLLVGSLNLSDIVRSQVGGFWHWHFFSMLLPMGVVFVVSALAETNRTPFDLPEAEAELVAGYFVEYSSFPFAMFFLGEYLNMMLMCGMISILFFGGWYAPIPALDFIPGIIWFAIKIFFFMFVFFWVRGTLPRYRYDQLMRLGWKVFLPLSLFWVVLVAGVVEYAGIGPQG
jgi:NADH-quinone oxidoreductase subunit H